MKGIVSVMSLVLALAGMLAVGQAGVSAPPVGFGAPRVDIPVPSSWTGKRPGHYGLDDWRQAIDSTWGPGQPVEEQLAIFDMFWGRIDSSFACFNNLDVSWDSLRTLRDSFRAEIIRDSVSRGRFAAIIGQSCLVLKEAHTVIIDTVVSWTVRAPGVPLFAIGDWWWDRLFGAGLTPLPDSTLLVYRAVPDQPLGLVPGDVVLGYDRRPWTELCRELLAAQLPIQVRWGWGSSPDAFAHSLLISAGMNWHLFDTIDIVKYSTGDTLHVPTSLLVGYSTLLLPTEQVPILGVPMPDTSTTQCVSYGVWTGTGIGYIYGWQWWYDAQNEFYNAVSALVSDTTLKGIIIDFRYNLGGNMMMSNPGLQLLFRPESTLTICFTERTDPTNHYAMRITDPASSYMIRGNGVGYDKPIAVLTGPACASSGDQVAFRMTFHDRARVFGKTTNAAFNAPAALGYPGWIGEYAYGEACRADDTLHYLTHREFPVDVRVWHTRDAAAHGEDAVANAARAWIDSVSAVAEPMPPAARAERPASTIVRGVLALPRDMTESSGDTDRVPRPVLVDISGRYVMALQLGPNDVRRLAPGVYFLRSASAATLTKVVVTR